MWSMKTETIPVVVGALGLVKKGLDKFIERIPGSISINLVPKTALLGSAHTPRHLSRSSHGLSTDLLALVFFLLH